MNILLVYAHPEARSFNGALRDTALGVLTARGHSVVQSDLHALNFDPIPGRQDYQEQANPEFFHLWTEQQNANANRSFTPGLQAEHDKLAACDLLLLQFPIWWFGPPAILKGWFDKVLSFGFAYHLGRWYNHGPLAGKKAALSITTGGPPMYYSEEGMNGPIETYLKAIQYGTLYFCGMSILPPFISYAAPFVDDETRALYIEQYKGWLAGLESATPLQYQTMEEKGAVPG